MFERLEAERLTACMQFALSVAFTVGFFVVTWFVLDGRAHLPADQLRLADALFGSLATILAQQSSYWFARQRGQTASPPEVNPPKVPLPPG